MPRSGLLFIYLQFLISPSHQRNYFCSTVVRNRKWRQTGMSSLHHAALDAPQTPARVVLQGLIFTPYRLFLTDRFTLYSPKIPPKSPYILTATLISPNDCKGL